MLTGEFDQSVIGIGVLPISNVIFYSPTKFAKNALYYVEMMGDYKCNQQYIVSRQTNIEFLEGFHFFIITSGCLKFNYQNRTFSAPAGSIVCIDCKIPHTYFAEHDVSFKWIAFGGSSSQAYCDLLQTHGEPVFFPKEFSECNSKTISMLRDFEKGKVNEHIISCTIHQIFSSLASILQENNNTTEQIISDIAEYIFEHFDEKIVVKDLADHCCISVFHFIRLFRRLHNCTPYEFILNTRLTHAKRLLITTAMSISAISQVSGFSTPSNFIRIFKTYCGLTPMQYRTFQP